ncbi:MAG: dihydroorotate dehydrogenase electron transfer subunit [Candidatus Gracilibacteria bacterium]|jgi:dihydroorotate dehydrogenase electron transfer subunit
MLKIVNNIPQAVTIKEVITETVQVKTFVLDVSLGAEPGQFVNLWIPGLNEKPFSVALDDGKEMHISIAAVGPFSQKMHELKAGDKVGIRGPFGTRFEFKKGQHLALLAGGYGAAPLYFLARRASEAGCSVEFILGARSKDLLLFTDRISALPGVSLHTATNDGSSGYTGFNTDLLVQIVEAGEAEGGAAKIDLICTVGPEIMMMKAMNLAQEKGISAQISVERYMKCGFGVCGNCVVDGLGVPTCISGPVMPLEKVLQIPDFGKYHRDSLGKKIYY